jgi:hypothetical protein
MHAYLLAYLNTSRLPSWAERELPDVERHNVSLRRCIVESRIKWGSFAHLRKPGVFERSRSDISP